MHTAIKALREFLPSDRVTWTEPNGGYLIWVAIDGIPGADVDVYGALRKHGVIVSPGEFYFPEVFGRSDGRLFTITQ